MNRGLTRFLSRSDLLLTADSFAAIHCSSMEGVLSDHMTYRLLVGRLGEFGSIMMLECSTGYFLGVGHRTLRCRANGTWEGSDDPATCKSKQWDQL